MERDYFDRRNGDSRGDYDDDDRGSRRFGGDRDEGDDRGGKRFGGGSFRKKVCRFCTEADYQMDYKNVRIMQTFLSEHGKIVPRRISGNCADHQRKLTTALKRARNLALVGYITPGPLAS